MGQREIKFRIWLKEKQSMTAPFALDHTFSLIGPFDKDEVLMQFTGLMDKNGTEIYEGDIVDHGDNFASEIFWDVGTASFGCRERGVVPGEHEAREHEFYFQTNPMTVLGNVFENPNITTY